MLTSADPVHEKEGARLARLAGISYLVIIAAGVSAELVIRAPLREAAPEELAQVLLSQLGLFRLSLLADLVMVSADIALALLFFYLLRSVGPRLAVAVLVLRLMQAAIIAMSLLLLTSLPRLAATGENELAVLTLEAHATGYDLGLFFFGLNSILMWKLLRLSGGVPNLIATGIGLSGLVYLVGSVIRLAMPGFITLYEPAYALPLLAETSFCLWLLIKARI